MMDTVDRYAVDSLESLVGTAHLVKSNGAVHPFPGNSPLFHNFCFVNRFCKDNTRGASRDLVENTKSM